jgi:hypothetical protein
MSASPDRQEDSPWPASVPPADSETGTRLALAKPAALVEAGFGQ